MDHDELAFFRGLVSVDLPVLAIWAGIVWAALRLLG